MTVVPFPTRPAGTAGTEPDIDPDDWESMAECTRTDPEAFFDDERDTKSFAKRVCDDCPVRVLCLAKSIKLGADGERVWGVWGGLEEKDRKKFTRAQRKLILAQASAILADAA